MCCRLAARRSRELRSRESRARAARDRRAGFTLVELMLAVAILSAISAVTLLGFGLVTRAWKRGISLADNLHHGDYVMDQLAAGLRSAYYPEKKDDRAGAFGLWLRDTSDGPYAQDELSWVKAGPALVGRDSELQGSAHRVSFSIEKDDDGEDAATVRAWQTIGLSKEFRADDVEPVYLSKRVVGFDCRCALKMEDGAMDWENDWDEDLTNRLPRFVELTLYLQPLEEGDSPVEVKRLVEIPVAPLSW